MHLSDSPVSSPPLPRRRCPPRTPASWLPTPLPSLRLRRCGSDRASYPRPGWVTGGDACRVQAPSPSDPSGPSAIAACCKHWLACELPSLCPSCLCTYRHAVVPVDRRLGRRGDARLDPSRRLQCRRQRARPPRVVHARVPGLLYAGPGPLEHVQLQRGQRRADVRLQLRTQPDHPRALRPRRRGLHRVRLRGGRGWLQPAPLLRDGRRVHCGVAALWRRPGRRRLRLPKGCVSRSEWPPH